MWASTFSAECQTSQCMTRPRDRTFDNISNATDHNSWNLVSEFDVKSTQQFLIYFLPLLYLLYKTCFIKAEMVVCYIILVTMVKWKDTHNYVMHVESTISLQSSMIKKKSISPSIDCLGWLITPPQVQTHILDMHKSLTQITSASIFYTENGNCIHYTGQNSIEFLLFRPNSCYLIITTIYI